MYTRARTLRLFCTSPNVGAFPFLLASPAGSTFLREPHRDIFIRSSPRDKMGITVSVPGSWWYCMHGIKILWHDSQRVGGTYMNVERICFHNTEINGEYLMGKTMNKDTHLLGSLLSWEGHK